MQRSASVVARPNHPAVAEARLNLPPPPPVGDGASLPEVLVAWADAPEDIEQINSLTLLVGSRSDEVREVGVWARIDGLGTDPFDVELGVVQIAPQSVETLTVDIDALPLQSMNRSITLLAFATFERDTQPTVTLSARPLAYHFKPGYKKALVYPHDVMVTDLEGGWLVPSPPMTTGRVLTDNGFVSLAAYLAQTGDLPIVDTPRVIPLQAPKVDTEPTAATEDIDPTCIFSPWECCTGDNCIDICADWTTSYVDTNYGEDYGLGSGTQHIEASYARYEIQRRVCNGYFCTYFNTGEEGYLGPDGCALNDLAPWKSHRIRVYTEHRRPFVNEGTTTYYASNSVASFVGTIALSRSFTSIDKDAIGAPPIGLPSKTKVTLPFHAAANATAVVSRGLAAGLLREAGVADGFEVWAGLGCDFGASSEACVDAGDVLYTGAYTDFDFVNGLPFATPGDLRWKNVQAHELGHVVQNEARAKPASPYCFTSSNFPVDHDQLGCPAGATPDPQEPSLSSLCKCSHVEAANDLHCLQSFELSSAAQVEGFGQFVASRIWNDPTGADCRFSYYKEFKDEDGNVIGPPFVTDCLEPVLWRDHHCFNLAAGTEYDWMQFYYRVTKPGSPVSLDDVFAVYRDVCGEDTCEKERVAWSELETSADEVLSEAEVEAFLSNGELHGVNEVNNLP